MALKLEFHPEARIDLLKQMEYVLQQFGQRDAEKAFQKVKDGISQLCEYPKSGVLMPDLFYNGNEVRVLHIRQLSIVYTSDTEHLYIVSIWNNYQAPERLPETIASRSV